jgi:hypothetical protein
LVGAAVKVTALPGNNDDGCKLTAGTTEGDTVIVMLLEVAVADDKQLALLVITNVTTSLFANEDVVNTALLVPAFVPFTLHWYDGLVPPLTGVAVNVTEVPAQAGFSDAAMLTEGVTEVLTVIVIELDVAVVAVLQVSLLVITTVTTSPLFIVLDVKIELLVPVFTPLTRHWYAGAEPPFTGVAVKVTDVPVQIDVCDAAIDTDGVTFAFTVIVIPFDVTVAGDGQVALLVIRTVTTFPFASVEEVKVALFVPAFTPFTLHWYVGAEPPFVGVAVKVTEVPAQMVV